MWFTEEAIEGLRASPRTTRGGQPSYSELAIATALTLRAVLYLALRQTEGLVASILRLLGLDLAVPDYTSLSRRAETPRCRGHAAGKRPCTYWRTARVLRLCGPGEWLTEKHGARRRRSWHKLHIATDVDTGRIVASVLTDHATDDGGQVGPLLEGVDGFVASFAADGAYDHDGAYAEVTARHPEAGGHRASSIKRRCQARQLGVVQPRVTATRKPLPSEGAWVGGERLATLAEADVSRWKRFIGDLPQLQTGGGQATEVTIVARVLVRDPQQRFTPQALLCTDLYRAPEQILRWIVQRWRLEVTFRKTHAHPGVETQRQWSDLAVARTTRCLLALFSLVTLLAAQLRRAVRKSTASIARYRKPRPSFGDTIATVRRHTWREQGLLTSRRGRHVAKPRPELQRAPAYSICQAA